MASAKAEDDYQFVLRHTTLKGAQMLALLSPPFLLISAYRKGNFRASTFLRKHAAWTFAAGPVFGFGAGWARLRNQTDEGITDRAERLRHNVTQVRTDDYSLIGSAFGAVSVSALMYGRAPLLFASVPGGASLGMAGGVIAHIVKSVMEQGDLTPEMMIEEAKEAMPLKKTVEEIEEGKGKKVLEGK